MNVWLDVLIMAAIQTTLDELAERHPGMADAAELSDVTVRAYLRAKQRIEDDIGKPIDMTKLHRIEKLPVDDE